MDRVWFFFRWFGSGRWNARICERTSGPEDDQVGYLPAIYSIHVLVMDDGVVHNTMILFYHTVRCCRPERVFEVREMLLFGDEKEQSLCSLPTMPLCASSATQRP